MRLPSEPGDVVGVFPPTLDLHPVYVATGREDWDGRLAMANGQLVAILVQRETDAQAGGRGGWLLEAGFGPCGGAGCPPFANLWEARTWIQRRLTEWRG